MRGGRYSPGASPALTQIVHYSPSYYTVFHSVIYNSVAPPHFISELVCRYTVAISYNLLQYTTTVQCTLVQSFLNVDKNWSCSDARRLT